METDKELEQLHQGCYLDQLFLYGGIMKNNELVGTNQDNSQDLWFNIGLVKLTPMETSRMKGARVVQIPLHTRYTSVKVSLNVGEHYLNVFGP